MDIDLLKILSDLQALGLTQSAIAAEIGCTQPAISDLMAGKIGKCRPSYKIVSGVHALAAKHGVPTQKTA